jgi:hypothetical protein
MAFGDNFDGSVDHFDGGLIVNRVRQTHDASRPLLCLGHGVARHAVRSQVWTDREVHYVETLIGTAELGNTFPAVCLPFGLAKWTLQTVAGEHKGQPPYSLHRALPRAAAAAVLRRRRRDARRLQRGRLVLRATSSLRLAIGAH